MSQAESGLTSQTPTLTRDISPLHGLAVYYSVSTVHNRM